MGSRKSSLKVVVLKTMTRGAEEGEAKYAEGGKARVAPPPVAPSPHIIQLCLDGADGGTFQTRLLPSNLGNR